MNPNVFVDNLVRGWGEYDLGRFIFLNMNSVGSEIKSAITEG